METRIIGIFRHGVTNGQQPRSLSSLGKSQVAKLAEHLANCPSADDSITILTSPAIRAVQSGQILAEMLNATCIGDDRLGNEYGDSDGHWVLEAIGDHPDHTVIVVTHTDAVFSLCTHFEDRLGIRLGLSETKLVGQPGHGVVFDLMVRQAIAI